MEIVLNYLIEIVCSIICVIVTTVLLPRFSRWLQAKSNSEILDAVICDLTSTVSTSVNMVEQTVVSQLKADGKWDSESQKNALKIALDEVIANLAESTISALGNNAEAIERVVTRYIESYIQQSKSNR